MKAKNKLLTFLILSAAIFTSCQKDPIKYSYSLDTSIFSDYVENQYCRTNISALNDENYPILAEIKPVSAYVDLERKEGINVNPFNTNVLYTRYAKEKLTSTKVINSIENILGEYTATTHYLFDRHYYYFDEDNNLIPNLKVINDSYGTNQWINIDTRLYQILKESIELSKFSDGKFNIFVGELSDLWDRYISYNSVKYGDKEDSYKYNEDPTSEEVNKCLSETPQVEDLDTILEFKENLNNDKYPYQVKFNKYKNADKVSITLGGIGKGYLTENLYQRYKDNDLTYGMVNAGTSSMVFFRDRVFSDNWSIALSNPYGVYYQYLGKVKLDNKKYAVSTSGAQVNFYYKQIGDNIVLRNHIIDPTTGYPNDYYNQILLISNTISSTKMDALSTILSNCSFDEIKDYVTKIRNDNNFGDLEFVFFKKDNPTKEEKVDVYLSKGIQKNKLFTKSNPTDCKVIYHNLDY